MEFDRPTTKPPRPSVPPAERRAYERGLLFRWRERTIDPDRLLAAMRTIPRCPFWLDGDERHVHDSDVAAIVDAYNRTAR